MTRLRQTIGVALATTCALLFLAGCGDDDDTTDSDTSVVDDADTTDDGTTDTDTDTDTDDGDAAGDSDDDAAADTAATPLAAFAGTWSGTWSNETFGSSGSIDIDVAVDETAGTATFTVDLGGFVFGGDDPEPEIFTIPLAGPSDPIQSATFGPIVMSTNADATAFSGVAGAVPSEAIESMEFGGTINEDGSVSGTYTVTFPDANTATGTFTFSNA